MGTPKIISYNMGKKACIVLPSAVIFSKLLLIQWTTWILSIISFVSCQLITSGSWYCFWFMISLTHSQRFLKENVKNKTAAQDSSTLLHKKKSHTKHKNSCKAHSDVKFKIALKAWRIDVSVLTLLLLPIYLMVMKIQRSTSLIKKVIMKCFDCLP